MSVTIHNDDFYPSIKTVIETWPKIEENLDAYRQEIANDYFTKYPAKQELFLNSSEETLDETVERKMYKHSVAVVNYMKAIVDFVKGNEETKPILFVLGKQHKRIYVSEKMFTEMKFSICDVLKARLGDKCSNSWRIVLEYIHINYVFQGMNLVEA